MHLLNNADQGFDAFRRERERVKSKLGSQRSVLGYENAALRELEQVEEREVRDQQLTREVHDFFAAATRQAAAIVEKVSHDAEERAGERMQVEVETFLMDTLSRMNGFIMSVMQQRPNANVAETHIEPDVKHLIGAELDEFRNEGSQETNAVHLGQDPFATDLEDVRREFRAVVADMDDDRLPTQSIEDHLVAEANPQQDQAASYDEPEQEAAEQVDQPDENQSFGGAHEAEVEHFDQATHSDLDEEAEPMSVEQELETFKNALKALVRQGIMQRAEAKAAWNARLVALGCAKA
jgi:hypothetical protein